MLMLTNHQLRGSIYKITRLQQVHYFFIWTRNVVNENLEYLNNFQSADVPYINCRKYRNVNVTSFPFPRWICPFIILFIEMQNTF